MAKGEKMELNKKAQKAIERADEGAYELMGELGGGSDGFWYDLVYGGYFKPEKVLAKKSDIKRVKDALKVLCELEEIYNQLTPEN